MLFSHQCSAVFVPSRCFVMNVLAWCKVNESTFGQLKDICIKRKMAWRSLGTDNTDLINQLEDYGVIKTSKVKAIMTATDRKHYCTRYPYIDAPQNIGHGATISAPHMHAYALELLLEKLKPGGRAMDVGSGSGYLTACLARALEFGGPKECGIVVGVEHHSALVYKSLENIKEDDGSLIDTGKIVIVEGDGRLGYEKYAPYDVIHVGAAAAKTPQLLLDQLKPGGRMICPVGQKFDSQYLEQYDKNMKGEVSKTRLMGVVFVPLTDLNST